MAKILSNGDIRIQMDADRTFAHILPELVSMAGYMVEVEMKVLEELPTDLKSHYIKRVHAIFGDIVKRFPSYGSIEEAKTKYKSLRGIDHISSLSVPELEALCGDLSELLNK